MNSENNVSHLNRDVRRDPSSYVNTPRFAPGSHTPAVGRKFVAKGHDSQLMDAQNDKHPVRLQLMSGAVFYGTVSKRDKFTITLRHAGGENAGRDEIFYKHAIESVLISYHGASA